MKVYSMLALSTTAGLDPADLQVGTLLQLVAKAPPPPTPSAGPEDQCIVLCDGDPIFTGSPRQRNGRRAVKIAARLPDDAIAELSGARVAICMGTAELAPHALVDLAEEAVIELDQALNDPGELYVNGNLVARGEVVTVGDDFGMRIAEVLR